MMVYFTHGTNSDFQGGWTMVDAADVTQAIALYRVFHPDKRKDFIDCTGIYSDSRFRDTAMYRYGNLGKRAVEMISVNRMIADGELFKEISTGEIG